MDQGPVDAGPNAGIEYDGPVRSPSPDDSRRRPWQPEESRSASAAKRHSDIHRANRFQEDIAASGASSRKHSDESLRDPPLFFCVGATTDDLNINNNDEALAGSTEKLREESREGKSASLLDGSGADMAARMDRGRVYKYTLYETTARYWITGTDLAEKVYRLLRIDRTSPPGQIGLFEDPTTYSLPQMNEVLTSIDEGNKTTGGLRKRYPFWGVLGFIRFTEAFYMLVITKRRQVAMIGGHYVYQIEGTELVPLTTGASSRFVRDRNPEETRFLNIFNNLDLNRSFYFSYAYDITNSLQHNIIRQREAINAGLHQAPQNFNSMFVWNHHLLQPALAALKHPFVWCLPIIHGFIDQASLDIFGRAVYITIIGRRSRFFAGARFLKRGVNDQGYVANDVETEQIVAEKLTTSFHAPGPRLYSNPTYTSYVQHRGSIPLYWTQDNSGVSPKPDINLNLQDPFYQPAALHFDNLFERYGCPVYVLNLIKARERTPRESKLLVEFQKCIGYLNQFLPTDKKILYKAFDMSRASKTRDGDVIGSLEVIAKEMVAETGFFRNGDEGSADLLVQNGVARTNCIDCLDRTNAAQFVLGKRAFALQLQELGVIDRDVVDYDTDAVNTFTHMFHNHGDTIAVQYGGSHLVNTMATYRKLNHWQSSSRDMVESFKRYYHNSFLDNQRQEAYNLFLGNYIWAQGQPMLWDLTTDYYLHHSDPRAWLERKRRDYESWYTPEFLEPKVLPPNPSLKIKEAGHCEDDVIEYDDYWTEMYRPTALSTLGKLYAFRVSASNRFLPERAHRDGKHDCSPFTIRMDPHRQSGDTPDKRTAPRKGVQILEPHEQSQISPRASFDSEKPPHSAPGGSVQNASQRLSSNNLQQPPLTRTWTLPAKMPPTPAPPVPAPTSNAADTKAQKHLWTLSRIHDQSLHPTVSEQEAREYDRYISHPLHLPLVVSTDLQPSETNADYVSYVHKAGGSRQNYTHDHDDAFIRPAVADEDVRQFWEFLRQRPDPLTLEVDDGTKKRYKVYRQWLRGKSLFKQSKVDPEARTAAPTANDTVSKVTSGQAGMA